MEGDRERQRKKRMGDLGRQIRKREWKEIEEDGGRWEQEELKKGRRKERLRGSKGRKRVKK